MHTNMRRRISWAVMYGLGTVSVVFGAESKNQPCTGHVDTKQKWTIQAGQRIFVASSFSVGARTRRIHADSRPYDWGRARGRNVAFKVETHDRDDHVCNIPQSPVLNYIQVSSLSVTIHSGSPSGPVIATVNLDTPSDPRAERTWTGAWRIPRERVGEVLVFVYRGTVDDVSCPSHPNSDDSPVQLTKAGLMTAVKINGGPDAWTKPDGDFDFTTPKTIVTMNKKYYSPPSGFSGLKVKYLVDRDKDANGQPAEDTFKKPDPVRWEGWNSVFVPASGDATTDYTWFGSGPDKAEADTIMQVNDDGAVAEDGGYQTVRSAKVHVLSVDIELSNTSTEDDDIVCRYSINPPARPTIPARARIQGLASGHMDVLLKNREKPAGGQVRFAAEMDTTKTLSLPSSGEWVSFSISGQVESGARRDAAIDAYLNAADGPLWATREATVLWVDPVTIRTDQNGAFSGDNDCSLKPVPARLGSQIVTGPEELEPGVAYVVELRGQVKPADFDQDIVLARDSINTFQGTEEPDGTFLSITSTSVRVEGGNDTGSPLVHDQAPRPNGNVYDWDMPGFGLSTGQGWPDHTKVFVRFNFLEYAAFNGVRCSDDFPWYARVTGERVGGTWHVYSRPDHADDNAAGQGSTNMTKD